MIYSFWLFDRHSEPIYQRNWHLEQHNATHQSADDVAKLIFGVVLSLRNISRKLTEDDSFLSFNTSKYKLHYFETMSNLKLVFLTDPTVTSLNTAMKQIYSTLYLEYVVKNPLSPAEHQDGAGVNNELFVMGLDAFVTGLPGYNSVAQKS